MLFCLFLLCLLLFFLFFFLFFAGGAHQNKVGGLGGWAAPQGNGGLVGGASQPEAPLIPTEGEGLPNTINHICFIWWRNVSYVRMRV